MKIILHKKKKIELENQELTLVDANQEERTLGVYVSPALTWVRVFQTMKEKMQKAMHKLKGTLVIIGNAYVFYNMRVMSQKILDVTSCTYFLNKKKFS